MFLSTPHESTAKHDDDSAEETTWKLGLWDKVGLIACGATLVSITLVLIVCMLGRGCYLFNRIYGIQDLQNEEGRMLKKKKQKLAQKRTKKSQLNQKSPITRFEPDYKSEQRTDDDDTSSLQGFVFGYGSQDTTSSPIKSSAGQGSLPILKECEFSNEEEHLSPTGLADERQERSSSDDETYRCIESSHSQRKGHDAEVMAWKRQRADGVCEGTDDSKLSNIAVGQPNQMEKEGRAEGARQKRGSQQRPEVTSIYPEAESIEPGGDGKAYSPSMLRDTTTIHEESDDFEASLYTLQQCEEGATRAEKVAGTPVASSDREISGHKRKREGYGSSPSSSMSSNASAWSNFSFSLPSAMLLSKKSASSGTESEVQSPPGKDRSRSTKGEKVQRFSSQETPPTTPLSADTSRKASVSSSTTPPANEFSRVILGFHLIKKIPETPPPCDKEDGGRQQKPQESESKDASQRMANVGLLTIKVENVMNLSSRNYSPGRDPFVRLVLYRDRRTLRKKSSHVMAEYETAVVKHSLNPVFNQAFTTEIPMAEFKNIRLKLDVIDADRHTKISDICSTSVALKDVKQLRSDEDPVRFSYFMDPTNQEFGELLLGLAYLPTAQRLSFSIIKAANLQFEEAVSSVNEFRPYVRVLQINSQNGKVMKKKKTGVKAGTREPQFDETINFDMPPDSLNNVVFLVLVSHRTVPDDDIVEEEEEEASQDSSRDNPRGASADELTYVSAKELMAKKNKPKYSSKHDLCIGTICLGPNVGEEKERVQWLSVIMTPRKALSMWQTIH